MSINKILWLLALTAVFATNVAAQPQVLASVKPLQLIAQAIVGEEPQVETLLPAGATPHHYTMRPSDMVKLNRADLIIWLGPESEQYLSKPVRSISKAKQVLDLQPLLVREDRHYLDPHLWLSSAKAASIAAAITEKLVILDGESESRYRNNLKTFSAAINAFRERAQKRLSELEIKYLVYHDAYGYFEDEYGLSHLGVVSLHPEVNPGAKQLMALQKIIQDQPVNCILIEPDSNAAVLDILTTDKKVSQLLLDPMANDISEGGYVSFLQQVLETFVSCHGSP